MINANDNQQEIFKNNIGSSTIVKISIASPFYNDDPSPWIIELAKFESAKFVELILTDDCSTDAKCFENALSAIKLWPGPAKIIKFLKNRGRSTARNAAITEANGDYILFLDSDMFPKDNLFLERYLEIANNNSSAVVYGGFTTYGAKINESTLLHHNISESSDCKPAAERNLWGAYAIASNNLLVRRDLMLKNTFSDDFKGWGWEDTEWGLRIIKEGYGLVHIDNPAIHLGLDTTETLLRKYQEAGQNLNTMLIKHPNIIKYKGTKAAIFIAKIPFYSSLRPILRAIVLNKLGIWGISIRRICLKIWRATWAAEAIRIHRKATNAA